MSTKEIKRKKDNSDEQKKKTSNRRKKVHAGKTSAEKKASALKKTSAAKKTSAVKKNSAGKKTSAVKTVVVEQKSKTAQKPPKAQGTRRVSKAKGAQKATSKPKAMPKTKGTSYTGTLIANRKGFGFVEVEELEEDIFIPHSGLNGAFHKDTVSVVIRPGRGARQEGVVEKILERGIQTVVGTYKEKRGFGYVIPDDQKISSDIHIAREQSHGAHNDCKVVALIRDYGGDHRRPEGEIVEVLGKLGQPGVDTTAIARSYGLPDAFPKEVMAQAEEIPDHVGASDIRGRLDLRDVMMVTIDGEDTKDFDDAVSLEKKGRYYTLGVHIADVSHYVKENTAMDRDALERGCSVYLPDRVIPMLPEKLSNGICSLQAGQDRLALSCIMTIDKKGNIKDYEIAESVINVDRRMTYTTVAALLGEPDKALKKEYKAFLPMFKKMAELSEILKDMRSRRGSIDFDLPESQLVLDENGHTVDIKPHERNAATTLIEHFMLSANETVARHALENGVPFLYRIHETPDADRIESLKELLRSFGVFIKSPSADIQPLEIQQLLAGMTGREEEDLIRTLSLRSMKQARYADTCEGHFGLAVKEYTHFTSPIRRYPDLQIHRILKEMIHKGLTKKRAAFYAERLPKVAKRCSERERRAVDAERDTVKLKCAEYMERHIGEEYEGRISGVTGWGVYVQLENTVEGMIPIAKMPGDDYDYRADEYAVVGRWTGKSYRLGERVKVQVEDVDLLLRTIDFSLVLN